MKTQSGYINIDFAAIFMCLLAVGVAIGLALAWLVPIVWGFVKPLIHAATS